MKCSKYVIPSVGALVSTGGLYLSMHSMLRNLFVDEFSMITMALTVVGVCAWTYWLNGSVNSLQKLRNGGVEPRTTGDYCKEILASIRDNKEEK